MTRWIKPRILCLLAKLDPTMKEICSIVSLQFPLVCNSLKEAIVDAICVVMTSVSSRNTIYHRDVERQKQLTGIKC